MDKGEGLCSSAVRPEEPGAALTSAGASLSPGGLPLRAARSAGSALGTK